MPIPAALDRADSTSRLAAALALGALCATPSAAPAQEPDLREHRFAATAGLARVRLRDENASPMRYGGSAPFAEIGFRSRGRAAILSLRAGAAVGTLTASTTSDRVPRQDEVRAWIEAEHLRVLRTPRTGTLAVGAALRLHGTTRQHFYADVAGSSLSYTFAAATLGPVATLERRVGQRARLELRAGAAALGMIVRSYGDDRLLTARVPLRLVAPGRYRAADLAAAATMAPARGLEVGVRYRFAFELLDDPSAFRSTSQTLGLVVAWRRGGGP